MAEEVYEGAIGIDLGARRPDTPLIKFAINNVKVPLIHALQITKAIMSRSVRRYKMTHNGPMLT